MNIKYDNQLLKNNFFKLHPQYLPFVGENYDEYRILQIGESHYIEQTEDNPAQSFGIDYFMNNWWTSECNDLLNENPWEYNTRKVINGFLENKGKVPKNEPGKFFQIFQGFSKAFCQGFLNKPNPSKQEKKDAWKYFAFTDLFMMPSIYKGHNISSSILKSFKKAGKSRSEAIAYLNEIEKYSVEVVDSIIDTIQPNIIISTSKRAVIAYQNQHGKYENDNRVFYANHPSSHGWYQNVDSGLPKIIEYFNSYKKNNYE